MRFAILIVVAMSVSGFVSASETCLKDSVLTIGGEVKEIVAYGYADNHEIKYVDASGAVGLKEIGEYAFLGCVNLVGIKFPESLQRIGEGAFRECGLKSVTLPESLKSLPKYAFAGCEKMEEVKFPDMLEDIGSHSFVYCTSLKDVIIPAGVKHMGSNVFSRCASLTEIVLPKDMKELESYAFSDCVNLCRVRLPENSNMLGELIFSGCVKLERIEELSSVPPVFDCDSFIFEPDDTSAYRRCRLVVKAGSERCYREANGWNLFENIMTE